MLLIKSILGLVIHIPNLIQRQKYFQILLLQCYMAWDLNYLLTKEQITFIPGRVQMEFSQKISAVGFLGVATVFE